MNYKSIWIVASVILLSIPLMQNAFAGSMRCGSHLISTGGLHGPGKYEVLKKCGEPTVRSGDTWIYENGGVKYVVVFDAAGYLARIG